MLKVCLHCGLHASLGSLLSPEQVNGVYHSVYIHKQPNCAKVEEVELQMSFFVAQCYQKNPEGINNSANLHIFSIPTLYVSTQRGNILSSFQHESQLLSGTWMDEEITDIRVRDWVILIMTCCNLIFSSTYIIIIIIIIYVICTRPMSPLKASSPLPQQTGL